MSADIFLDTNLLIYSVIPSDWRSPIAAAWLASGATISVQVLNEFVHVASRKLRKTWPEIGEALGIFRQLFPKPRPLDVAEHDLGLSISERYNYTIYEPVSGRYRNGRFRPLGRRSWCSVIISKADIHPGRAPFARYVSCQSLPCIY